MSVTPATKVGVRDLKAHLSHYLERAANGERFLVTSHQKVVAELNPASSTEAADGIPDLPWLTKPTKPLKLPRLEDLIPLEGEGPTLSEMIVAERDERLTSLGL
jgi:prevent-host-death family protein